MPTPDFRGISPTTLGPLLPTEQFMDHTLVPLWEGARLEGPAYTVRLPPGENLALHAAIYRAPAGSVLVVQAGDARYAVAGGNVCAVAQARGLAGLIVDGVVRDRAEIRERRFPVFARGVRPIPGGKAERGEEGISVVCGGVQVHPGDFLVADEEGVACIPAAQAAALAETARARQAREASEGLDAWTQQHRESVRAGLARWGESLE